MPPTQFLHVIRGAIHGTFVSTKIFLKKKELQTLNSTQRRFQVLYNHIVSLIPLPYVHPISSSLSRMGTWSLKICKLSYSSSTSAIPGYQSNFLFTCPSRWYWHSFGSYRTIDLNFCKLPDTWNSSNIIFISFSRIVLLLWQQLWNMQNREDRTRVIHLILRLVKNFRWTFQRIYVPSKYSVVSFVPNCVHSAITRARILEILLRWIGDSTRFTKLMETTFYELQNAVFCR